MITSRTSHTVWKVLDHIKKSNHRWVGHVARLQDNRLTTRATSWLPRARSRPRGRPKLRWRDDLLHHLGPTCMDKVGPRQMPVEGGVPPQGRTQPYDNDDDDDDDPVFVSKLVSLLNSCQKSRPICTPSKILGQIYNWI